MAKENWVADRIKVADQLTLKQGEYLGSYGWVQCNHKSPESGRDNRKGGQSDAMGGALTPSLQALNRGKKNQGPKNAAASRGGKGKKTDSLPWSLQKRTQP